MPEPNVTDPSGSVTRGFLFADLRDYTAYIESRGDDAGAELLRVYRSLVRDAVGRYDGAEIRTEGDSFYVVFPSASSAVRCGVAIVEAASGVQPPVRVGVGVHAGESTETDEGYVGSAVNIAARICAQARPGEVLVSDTVRALVRTRGQMRFASRGTRRLKGIHEPVELFAVSRLAEGAAHAPTRPLVARAGRFVASRFGIASLVVLAIVLVGGSALVLSAAVDGLGRVNDSSASPVVAADPSASPSEGSPAPQPTSVHDPGEEARLIARLDTGISRLCESADLADAPIIGYGSRYREGVGPAAGNYTNLLPRLVTTAGLRCSLGDPDTVLVWKVRDADEIGLLFAYLEGIRNIPGGGDCADGARASYRWEYGGSGGRMLCSAFGGETVLWWSYDDADIVAQATDSASDIGDLHRWWRDNARTLNPER